MCRTSASLSAKGGIGSAGLKVGEGLRFVRRRSSHPRGVKTTTASATPSAAEPIPHVRTQLLFKPNHSTCAPFGMARREGWKPSGAERRDVELPTPQKNLKEGHQQTFMSFIIQRVAAVWRFYSGFGLW